MTGMTPSFVADDAINFGHITTHPAHAWQVVPAVHHAAGWMCLVAAIAVVLTLTVSLMRGARAVSLAWAAVLALIVAIGVRSAPSDHAGDPMPQLYPSKEQAQREAYGVGMDDATIRPVSWNKSAGSSQHEFGLHDAAILVRYAYVHYGLTIQPDQVPTVSDNLSAAQETEIANPAQYKDAKNTMKQCIMRVHGTRWNEIGQPVSTMVQSMACLDTSKHLRDIPRLR